MVVMLPESTYRFGRLDLFISWVLVRAWLDLTSSGSMGVPVD